MTKENLINIRKGNRDNKIIYDLLGTIIGELDRTTKAPSEEQVMTVLSKMYKANQETINGYISCNREVDNKIQIETDFLKSQLPKELSEDEMISIVDSLLTNNYDMKNIMGYFKSSYGGQYDGKKLSEIVRNKIK